MADEILDNLNQELPEEIAAIPEMQDVPEIEEVLDKEPPVPPLSEVDELLKISSETVADETAKINFDYQAGKTLEFSAKQANFEKYYSYGSDIYGKLGFNPFLGGVDTDGDGKKDKSGMDHLYDENTDFWDDWDRSSTGMYELLDIGFNDTFLLGAFHDDENYKSFGDVMQKYSSSKKGTGGFINNTKLSAGYTMGIIKGIAYEEAVLALTTWGAANIGTAGAELGRLGKGLQKAGSWMNRNKYLKVADDLQDMNKARNWLGRRVEGVKKGAKGFVKMVNPIGETVDFIRNADRLSEFTKLQRVAIGAATLTRDMRKIYLAHSEGKLEADMAEEEFRQTAWDEWYKQNPNSGIMPEEQQNLINAEAARVNSNVYAGNFGLIYLTNAVTFNSLFRSGKSVRRLFGMSANGLYKVGRTQGGKALVQHVARTPANYIRNKVSDWTYKGTLKAGAKSSLTSSMEGVQELGQDILSDSFKNYHIRNTLGTQTEGGFLHYLNNDLVNSINKQNSEEGFITFASGMFMGVFASPVSFANTQATKFFQGSGYISAAGTYQKTFNKKQYKKQQEEEQKRLEENAERLTEFFNKNKTFIKASSMPIYRQVELQQEMLDAAEKGHTKDFKNAKHDALIKGAQTLIDNGLVDEYIEQLEYFASDAYTTKDLQELFERPDLTDKDAQEKREQLLANAKMLKDIKQADSIIKSNLPNPYSLVGLKPGDENYNTTLYKYYAWKNLQQELLFNSAKIKDRKQRLESIKKLIGQTNSLAAELSVESLVDLKTLNESIRILKAEVSANKDLDLTGEAALQALTSEKRLAALEEYSDAMQAYRLAFDLGMTAKFGKGSISNKSESEYYEEFFEAYNNVLKEYGLNKLSNLEAQREVNEKSFDLIFDYVSLETATGEYTKYVEILETGTGQADFLTAREQVLERIDANKKVHIKNALESFYEKQVSDEMLKELYDLGFFFDLNAIDSLMRDGIMPMEILDLNNENQPVTDEQYMIAQEIMQKHVGKLVGKKLIRDKFEEKSQGRKLLSDKRTVDDILNEYGISLNKNIKLTGKKGKVLLEQILDPKNKNLTKVDREILVKVIEGNSATLKFVANQTLPIEINAAGVITIDVRYAGEDYINSAYSIENLVTTALTQSKIASQLKENDDLWLQTRMAMKQAKEVYAKTYPEEDVEEMAVFNDVTVFLSEALNDRGFQDFLAQITDTIAPAKKSLWSTVKKGTKEILGKEFESKLLNRVMNIAAKAVDEEIVDNISEVNIKARTEEDESALEKKVEDLNVLANEIGLKWNVNVKVLKDQNEAQQYLDKIENPFYSKEDQIPGGFYDEKTNTAYIIAEDVKANTAMHEIFLHPFLINAEKNNPELYKSLVAEAKSDQTVIDYVEANYGKEEIIGTRQFEHELIGRVYDLAADNKISEKEKPGLFKKAYELMKALLKATGEFLRILPRDIAKFKPGKTTIKDLAEYSRSERSGFNLGKVVLEPIRPEPKVEKKIKVSKTKTTEVQVNVGGNTVVMTEARDQPSLMEDFINDDIQLENADSVNAATDELVALGKELDELDVLTDETNWKFGDLRVEIDGRLIIDVIANGKRFLMYKSTGTGTTADTAGEWTPLLYFGTQLKKDGTGRKGWFVKAAFEGQDPKKNKYGSKTFIGLDSLLKAQESELFTGQEQIETRTETEEIEVVETPTTEKAIEEGLEEDDTLETIQNKIENLEAQVAEQEQLRLKGKLNIREKARVKKKMTRLKMLINELERKRKELNKIDSKADEKLTVKEEVEFEAELDYNGNEIITPEMPFSRLPKALQIEIASIYGKTIGALNEADIEKINKERKSNPIYISAVNAYVEQRLERQNKILGEQEVKINQEKVDRAKAKRQAELKSKKEGGRKKQTIEDKIREMSSVEMLVKENSIMFKKKTSLLTEKEINTLADKIRNQTGIVPFGFDDVRAFILNKKRKQEKRKKAQDTIQYAKDLAAERAREKVIKDNINRLGTKGTYSAPIVKSIDPKTQQKEYKENNFLIPAGMREFLLKYHPDLFIIEDLDSFNLKLTAIMKKYRSDVRLKTVVTQTQLNELVQGDITEVKSKLEILVNSLEVDKQLYPTVVRSINAALNEANIKLTVKRLSGSRLENDSSLYGIYETPNKKTGEDVFTPNRGKTAGNKKLIDDFNFSLDNSLLTLSEMTELYFASLLLDSEVYFPRSVFESIDPAATASGKYDSLISEEPSTWIFGISENASYTSLGDKLVEVLAGELLLDTATLTSMLTGNISEGVAGIDEVIAVLQDNFTKQSIIKYYGELIRSAKERLEEDDSLVPEDLQSLIEYAKWSTTEEGKKTIEKDLKSLSKDRIAFDAMIAEEYLKEEEDFEEDVAYKYFKTEIADVLSKKKTVGQQLKILWDLLNKEKEGDLNFVKAYADYAEVLNMTKKQRNVSNALIDAQFGSGVALGAVINIEGIAYIVNDYIEESNKVEIQLLNATELDGYILLSSKELLSQMTEELKAGSIFNGQVIDTVANTAEIQYIKEAYSDILTNFTKYNKEAESLSDEQLLEDLKTEITKCK